MRIIFRIENMNKFTLLLTLVLSTSLGSYSLHAREADVAEPQDLTAQGNQNGQLASAQAPYETEYSIKIKSKTKAATPPDEAAVAEPSKTNPTPAVEKPEADSAKGAAPAKEPTIVESIVSVGSQVAAAAPPVQEIVDGYKGIYKTATEAATAEVEEYIRVNGKAPSKFRQFWIGFKHGFIGSFVYTAKTFGLPIVKAVFGVGGK
jgi:hypothetical protein